jgi:hypothetical protein
MEPSIEPVKQVEQLRDDVQSTLMTGCLWYGKLRTCERSFPSICRNEKKNE